MIGTQTATVNGVKATVYEFVGFYLILADGTATATGNVSTGITLSKAPTSNVVGPLMSYGLTDIQGQIISNVRDLKINTKAATYMTGTLVVPKV